MCISNTKSKMAILSGSQPKVVSASHAAMKLASHQAPPVYSVVPRRTVGETICRPLRYAAPVM